MNIILAKKRDMIRNLYGWKMNTTQEVFMSTISHQRFPNIAKHLGRRKDKTTHVPTNGTQTLLLHLFNKEDIPEESGYA